MYGRTWLKVITAYDVVFGGLGGENFNPNNQTP